MKILLKTEEFALLCLAIFLNSRLEYPVWLFWLLFLAPDFSMVGYLVSDKVGAITYNIFHHKGVAIAAYFAGVILALEPLQFAGLLLLGHSSFDRILGYGLKYPDSFHHTHMGWIGKHPNER